jgi:hypothetical protein
MDQQMQGSNVPNTAPDQADDDALLGVLEQQAMSSSDAAGYHARELERHRRIVRSARAAMRELHNVGDTDAGIEEIEKQDAVLRAGPPPSY